jgi:hypothetical protein
MNGDPDPVTQRARGYLAVLVGIVLVVLARGCDSLGNRNVARQNARVQLAVQEFDEEWAEKEQDLQGKIDTLLKGDLKPEEQEKVSKLREEQRKLATDKATERAQRERDDWRELRFAAATASARNATWAYWREGIFLIGALALSIGVVLLAMWGAGPERWVGLVILAIIVFGLFVVGAPWSGPNVIGNLLR